MRKFDLSLRSSRSSYFATFRHQLTILSKTDALDEEKWLNMLGTFVKDWFRYESHFVHGRDSLVDILKERGLLSESDAVQPLIGNFLLLLSLLLPSLLIMFIPSTFKRPVSSWKALNLRKTLLMASSVRLKPLNCSRLPCVYAQETLTFLLTQKKTCVKNYVQKE